MPTKDLQAIAERFWNAYITAPDQKAREFYVLMYTQIKDEIDRRNGILPGNLTALDDDDSV